MNRARLISLLFAFGAAACAGDKIPVDAAQLDAIDIIGVRIGGSIQAESPSAA
jgi:hypothetical protein